MKKPLSVFLALLTATPLLLRAADPAADNSAKNERDRSGETVTAQDQSNDPADIKLTAEIRKAVVADDTLSMAAKNVKIITTAGGAVTLRGPVESAKEKATIAAHAESAGASHVKNELEVKTQTQN